MFWTLLCLGVGWLLGRNWDQVKKMYREKITTIKNNAGNTTKID